MSGIRIYHRQQSDQSDDNTLPAGVIKPQSYWNQDPHKLGGILSVYEWEPQFTPVDNNWRSICHSEVLNLYVAISSNGTLNRVMTSTDSETWVIGTTPSPERNWVKVIRVEELGLFIAVGENGIMTSPDGFAWTLQTVPSASGWHDVDWSPELQLLTAIAWSGHPNQVMTSLNAVNWVLRTTPLDAQWESIRWCPDLHLWLAGADSGTVTNRVMRSTTGLTWTLCTIPSIANSAWYTILPIPDGPVILLNRSTNALVSLSTIDGITFIPMAGGFATQWNCAAYSAELALAIAISTQGRIMATEDFQRWKMVGYGETADWQDVIWVDSAHKFVSVGQSGVGSRIMMTVP